MKAEILSIGTELLNGHITDTNATFLAQQLVTLGIQLKRVTEVGDGLEEIAEVISGALRRADLIICTGGIGPTPDDLTREAISSVLGEKMEVDPDLENTLRSYFSNRGRDMPRQNIKQATLIPSARSIRNRSGTAPGWWVEKDHHTIITMPGVPHEMKTIWAEEVLPKLQGISGNFIVTEILKYSGTLGESGVAQALGDLLSQENPWVATYAKPDGIHVTVQGNGPDRQQVRSEVDAAVRSVRQILGDTIWGTNAETLADVVKQQLNRLGYTLSTSEDATTGHLAEELLTTPALKYIGGTVLDGQLIHSDLTLRVGPARVDSSTDIRNVSCEVDLLQGTEKVDTATVHTSSLLALRERTVNTAILLLYRYLKALEAAVREPPETGARTSGR